MQLPRQCLDKAVELQNLKIATSSTNHLRQMISTLVRAHDFNFALEATEDLVDKIANTISGTTIDNGRNGNFTDILLLLSAVERTVVDLLLGVEATLTSYDEKCLREHAQNLKSGRPLHSYWKLPSDVAQRCKPLISSLQLEVLARAKTVSPVWYIHERIRLELLRSLQDVYEKLFPALLEIYETLYGASENSWCQAIVLSGQAEFLAKAEMKFDELEQTLNSLENEKVISGLPWPTISFSSSREALAASRRTHTDRLAEVGAILWTKDKLEHFPDFAGQFHALVREAVFNAIVEQNADELNSWLPGYFSMVLVQTSNQFPNNLDANDPRTTGRLLHATAHLLDAVEILGLGKIVSEFSDNMPLWQLLENMWLRASQVAHPFDINQLAAGIQNISEGGMTLEAHHSLRFRWRRRLESLMESAPAETSWERDGSIVPFERIIPTHQSPLVRIFTPKSHIGLSDLKGIPIFIMEVIRPRAPEGTSYPDSHSERRLRDKLRRELS